MGAFDVADLAPQAAIGGDGLLGVGRLRAHGEGQDEEERG